MNRIDYVFGRLDGDTGSCHIETVEAIQILKKRLADLMIRIEDKLASQKAVVGLSNPLDLFRVDGCRMLKFSSPTSMQKD